KLNGEKWIAFRLLVDQLRQRSGPFAFAAESVLDQLCQVFAGKRRKDDLLHRRSGFADRIELPYQRMGGIDLIVPVSPDQQQVAHIRLGQKILDQIESCRIEPLQIVEEQGKRMLGPREHSDESPKDELESTLGVLWRKVGNRRRFSDDELQ